jgi:predicted amidohydrolase YtcJ
MVALGATVVSQSTQVAAGSGAGRSSDRRVDAQTPEGTALAARNGAIVAVGTDAAIASYIGPSTQVIDLAGQLAIPGFIEGHVHFSGIGDNKLNLDLMGTKSWDEIVHMVALAVEQAKRRMDHWPRLAPGEVVVHAGSERRGFLDASVARQGLAEQPGHPHARERSRRCERKAPELSNTKATANPNGGEILKDKDGNPTGLLRETASGLVRANRRAASNAGGNRSARRESMQLADQEVISKGITSFQDAGSRFDMVNRVKRLIDAGKMNAALGHDPHELGAGGCARHYSSHQTGRIVGYGNNQLTVRAIKIVADGARFARRLAARAVLRQARQRGIGDDAGRADSCGRAGGVRERLSGLYRHRRSRHREVLNAHEDTFKKNSQRQDCAGASSTRST